MYIYIYIYNYIPQYSDTELIQDGIGDKVGIAIQSLATFVTSFVIGFYRGWKMAFVLLSVVPLLIIMGGILGKLMSTLSVKGQAAYAAAGAVAEEVISSIRTVAAFSGEKHEGKRYAVGLGNALKTGIKKAHVTGLSIGFTMLILYGSYALAFWYGSTLVDSGEMTAGSVTTVFFAIVMGAFALGRASPSFTAFAEARGAAYKVFEVIDRVSPIDCFSDKGQFPSNVQGKIEFKNVKFSYPTRPDIEVRMKRMKKSEMFAILF